MKGAISFPNASTLARSAAAVLALVGFTAAAAGPLFELSRLHERTILLVSRGCGGRP